MSLAAAPHGTGAIGSRPYAMSTPSRAGAPLHLNLVGRPAALSGSGKPALNRDFPLTESDDDQVLDAVM